MKWVIVIFCWITPGWVFASSFQLFKEDGKVGLKNEQGVVLLPPSFEALGWSDGSFSVIGDITGYKLHGHWGLINLKKEFITKAEYESLIYSGADRVVAIKKISGIARKTGSLTLTGTVTIPFVYDDITIHGLRAIVINKVGIEYQYGVTDLSNKVIIPLQYSNVYPVSSIRFAVGNKAGKLALFSDAGKQATDFFIDSISPYHRNYAIIYSNGWKGIIDRDGIVVADAQYCDIKFNADGTVQGLARDHWKIVDDQNKELNAIQADALSSFLPDSYCVVRAGKTGVVDKELKEVWPFEFDFISNVIHDKVAVKKDGKWGLLDTNRNEVITFVYDSIVWDGDFAIALTHEWGKPKWHLINPVLNTKSKSYDAITRIDDVFLASRNGFVGLLNKEGKESVHCVYDSIIAMKENQVVVRFKGYYGVITQDEQWILAPQHSPVSLVNDSLYLLKDDTITYLKSFTGNLVYFTENALFAEPFFLSEKTAYGGHKRIDFNGVVMKTSAEGVSIRGLPLDDHAVNDGLRVYQGNGKFGFRDMRGRLVIPNRYDSAKAFHDQMAAFKLLGRWGYLDTQDKMIIHPTYDYAGDFIDGYAIVSRNKKIGLINKSGDVVLSLNYDGIERIESFLKLKTNKKSGLATLSGKLLMEPHFDELRVLPNNQVIVSLNRKYGVVSSDGLSIIPPVYKTIAYDQQKKVYLAHQIADCRVDNPESTEK